MRKTHFVILLCVALSLFAIVALAGPLTKSTSVQKNSIPFTEIEKATPVSFSRPLDGIQVKPPVTKLTSDEQKAIDLLKLMEDKKRGDRPLIARKLRLLPSVTRDRKVLEAHTKKTLSDWEAVTALGAPQTKEAKRFLTNQQDKHTDQNVRIEARVSLNRHMVLPQ